MHFKKAAIIIVLLGAFLWCSGCETARGLVRGVSEVGQGVGKDVSGAWGSLKKADEWFKENLW